MFYKGLGKISANEALIYNYWTVVCTLLEHGLTRTEIDEMSSEEVSMFLAVLIAKKERENEGQARAQHM